MDWAAIITAALTAGGVILAAVVPVVLRSRAQMKEKLRMMELELRFQADVLSFDEYAEEWNEIHMELGELLENTMIDRFMLMRAWNGSTDPQWTTSVFQWRAVGQVPVAYIRWEIDDDYLERLSHIVGGRGPLLMKVAEMPPSAIRDAYEAEGVTAAVWFYLYKREIESGSKSKALVYCSFATHSENGEIDRGALAYCRRVVGRMKAIGAGVDEKKTSEVTTRNSRLHFAPAFIR